MMDSVLYNNNNLIGYSEDTMILTSIGWLKFKDLNLDTLIAQVEEDGSYHFDKPLELFNYEYNNIMHHYTDFHGKIDLMVTPNQLITHKQNGKWKTIKSSSLKQRSYEKKFIRSSPAKNKGTELTNEQRLRIAFQADGSKCSDTDKRIRFSFSKIRKINRMRSILNTMNLSYKEYDLKDGRIEFNIAYPLSNVSKKFDWVDKSKLCSNWCNLFIEELSHWDSSIRNRGRIKFDTTNYSVVKTVEIIALSAGYGCLITEYEDNRSDLFSKVYTANILFNNEIGGASVRKEVVDYNGIIFSVATNSGKIITKRNRGVIIGSSL